jgi:metal-responsive CopG/Arc/MetJ family transcriptional regulator
MDEKAERFEMRVTKSFLQSIDDWRRRQEDLPTRAEAIRRLVELGIRAKSRLKAKPRR